MGIADMVDEVMAWKISNLANKQLFNTHTPDIVRCGVPECKEMHRKCG